MPFSAAMDQTRTQTAASTDRSPAGGRIVTADGRSLPLRSTELRADACAGIARVILRQRFVNRYEEPLRVTYQVPLPTDGAVSGYAFELRDRRIVGEVDRKASARERFEEAILDGRSAALLEQDRSSLFTQEIGNVPPGEEIVTELCIDQPLGWVSEGAWEWRFPTVVAPRYMGAPGRVSDAARVSVDVADRPITPRASLTLHIRDPLLDGATPESPSHAVICRPDGAATEIGFREEAGARLDRDVVVRWTVGTLKPGAALDVARPASGSRGDHGEHAYGLLALVPPSPGALLEPVARDLIVLLDTSGSMHGQPLDQARRVTLALIDTLQDRDSLELIEFSNRPRRWRRRAARANAGNKKDAMKWVNGLSAGGGTEMRSGIIEALSSLRRDAQRQVILATDGLIGFEDEIVAEVMRRLPRGSQVHTLGIGSGVNRSLTGPVARAGAGIEVLVGIGEDPERAAKRLVAATDAPQVIDVKVSGSAVRGLAQYRPRDLMAGAPALIPLELSPGGGEVIVTGRTAGGARWQERLEAPALEAGCGSPAVTTLFGREKVEDLEMRRAAGERGLDGEVETIGLTFQIATRLTSWVAVSSEQTVDTADPTRNERVPHELPHGMSVEGLGLRAAAPTATTVLAGASLMQSMAVPAGVAMAPPAPPSRKGKSGIAGIARGIGGLLGRKRKAPRRPLAAAPHKADEREKKEALQAGDEIGFGSGAGGEADLDAEPAPAAEAPAELERGIRAPADRRDEKLAIREARAQISDEFAGNLEEAASFEEELDELSDGVTVAPTLTRTGDVGPVFLEGRITLRKDSLLAVEITVEAAFLWEPGREVMLQLPDGTSLSVRVDAKRTTRAGSLPAGSTVRLVLILNEPLHAAPDTIVLGGGSIVVAL